MISSLITTNPCSETTWRWQFTINGTNLTWVNFSASGLSEGSNIKMLNGGGLWSHDVFRRSRCSNFSCSNDCVNSTAHERTSSDGYAAIIALTWDPSPERGEVGGLCRPKVSESRLLQSEAITHTHSPTLVLVEIIEKGTNPPNLLRLFHT